MTARITDPLPASRPTIAANSGSRSTGTSVVTVSPTASSSAGQLEQELPPLVDAIAQGDEDLLLAVGPREVALARSPCGSRA